MTPPPPSFLVVGDLLEETITRTAKTQNGADGELAWLRKRLDNERRDPRARGKLALESDGGSSNSGTQPQARAIAKDVLPADKENAAAGKHGGSRANKVRSLLRQLMCVVQSTWYIAAVAIVFFSLWERTMNVRASARLSSSWRRDQRWCSVPSARQKSQTIRHTFELHLFGACHRCLGCVHVCVGAKSSACTCSCCLARSR